MADMITARQQHAYGVSIDETFRVPGKFSVHVIDNHGNKHYNSTAFALHTAHSLTTNAVIGFRLMPDKSANQKSKLLHAIFAAQKAPGSQRTRFVATDCPWVDRSMVHATWTAVFGTDTGHDSTPPDLGDDCYHARDRLARTMPLLSPARTALKRIFGRVYAAADDDDAGDDPFDGALSLVIALRAWQRQYQTDRTAGFGAETMHALRLACERASYLFAWMPHKQILQRYGTTCNEMGNFMWNRRFDHASHIRIDHGITWLEYSIFLLNARLPGTLFKYPNTTAALQRICVIPAMPAAHIHTEPV